MTDTTTPLQAAVARIFTLAKQFGFQPEEEYRDESQTLSFSTRAHGSVGDETPAAEDIRTAHKLKTTIRAEFPIPVSIDTCDEWVMVELNVCDLPPLLDPEEKAAPSRPKP